MNANGESVSPSGLVAVPNAQSMRICRSVAEASARRPQHSKLPAIGNLKFADPTAPAATAPRQRSKPLLPRRGVCSLVNEDENRVLDLIESGEIAWAFDVALVQRRGRRREFRVLPAAVADYLQGRPCELDQQTVFGLLVPDVPTIPANRIARILNVT